jgi:hypothetical protein
MTEEEWLTCAAPPLMLEFLRGRASERKLRLFACACCRDPRLFGWLAEPRNRQAVAVAERFADGQASAAELEAALRLSSHNGVVWACSLDAHQGALAWAECGRLPPARRAARVEILRDLFGNPFRPVALLSAWQTPDVRSLAQAAYDHRGLPGGTLDGARLAVLADALEEAGCTDRALLDHLRGPGPHVRGCWAVDLLLAKE